MQPSQKRTSINLALILLSSNSFRISSTLLLPSTTMISFSRISPGMSAVFIRPPAKGNDLPMSPSGGSKFVSSSADISICLPSSISFSSANVRTASMAPSTFSSLHSLFLAMQGPMNTTLKFFPKVSFI